MALRAKVGRCVSVGARTHPVKRRREVAATRTSGGHPHSSGLVDAEVRPKSARKSDKAWHPPILGASGRAELPSFQEL